MMIYRVKFPKCIYYKELGLEPKLTELCAPVFHFGVLLQYAN